MKKDPAFLFYSSDFLTGVVDLTNEEVGQYIKLLCLQHQKGRLTKKAIKLAVGEVSDDVMCKFDIDENGLYYNKRLEVEAEKRNYFISKQTENGRKGGRPTTQYQNPDHNPNVTQTKPKHNPDHNPNKTITEDENDNENKNRNKIIDVSFDEFWKIYPRKVAKAKAYAVWKRIKPDEGLLKEIMLALDDQRKSEQWTKDRGQFIPHPATWLNQRRWEDEPTVAETNQQNNASARRGNWV